MFSSIVWTSDVACPWSTFLGVKEGLEILFEVDCLPECIDFEPVHGQKYLFSHLTELKIYQILVGIRWDT